MLPNCPPNWWEGQPTVPVPAVWLQVSHHPLEAEMGSGMQALASPSPSFRALPSSCAPAASADKAWAQALLQVRCDTVPVMCFGFWNTSEMCKEGRGGGIVVLNPQNCWGTEKNMSTTAMFTWCTRKIARLGCPQDLGSPQLVERDKLTHTGKPSLLPYSESGDEAGARL